MFDNRARWRGVSNSYKYGHTRWSRSCASYAFLWGETKVASHIYQAFVTKKSKHPVLVQNVADRGGRLSGRRSVQQSWRPVLALVLAAATLLLVLLPVHGAYAAPIASSAGSAGPVTAYVANDGSGTVTPIPTATNTAGPPITVGGNPYAIAITPDGKTAYVANDIGAGTVTPIATATNTAGRRSRSALTQSPSRSRRTARPPTSPTTARAR